ncbi:hypothetical protein KC19_4G005300 [Ceratodon purpureus]|uniref:Uncharacterized protein n=1 Tax=Ceratodon purpureus TaxID=3225 RepID=A0A8T0I3W7_CERPU|nr:hypothetical protein KC19_4G005300 [Ceratodon purpureus]
MKSCRDCLEEENDCSTIPMWIQKTIVLPVQRRGCHNITHLLMRHLESDLSCFKCGLAHIF